MSFFLVLNWRCFVGLILQTNLNYLTKLYFVIKAIHSIGNFLYLCIMLTAPQQF